MTIYSAQLPQFFSLFMLWAPPQEEIFTIEETLALLGIEIGGTKLVLTVGNDTGEPISHLRRPMEPSGDWATDLERIAEDARRLLGDAGIPLPRMIGVSAPGPCELSTGIISQPPNLPGWDEVPIVQHLGAALGAPVRLENDANAAALAEWKFGQAEAFEISPT